MHRFQAWIRTLAREARRRRVYTSVAAYLALSMILIQLGEAVFAALLMPDWAPRLLTLMLILGFPVVVVLAWAFDIGPGGVTRTDATSADGASVPAPGRAGRGAAALRVTAPPRPASAPVRAVAAAAALRLEEVVPDPARVQAAALAHARHELRTPINAIIGYGEMLLEDAKERGDSAAATGLDSIRAAGRDLLARVDRILDSERVAALPGANLESLGEQIRADLRDPATAVIGHAERLRETDDVAMRADLDRILGAARRLLDMSGDLVRVATQPAQAGAHAAAGSKGALAAAVLSHIQPLVLEGTSAEERQGSLLVVDDSPINRDLLSRQLARKGYVVATCENGRDALDRLERDRFDVVLLDIIMPEVDGVEVLRRIRANPLLNDLPVIMISSLNEIDGAVRCLEMGAADYLTKPFHPTLLDARIGAVLESRRLREREAHYRRQLEDEQVHLHRLALGACPPAIAERVRRGDIDWVESYLEIGALWCDVGRGVRTRAAPDPAEHAATLGRCLGIFEQTAQRHGLETVMRAGSAVLIAAGVSAPRADAARDLAACALDIAGALAADGFTGLAMGLHTGAGFGGVVGDERLSFQLWGEAVDMARALESIAPPGAICASPAAHALLRDAFALSSLGVVDVGGGTQMKAWRLNGILASA